MGNITPCDKLQNINDSDFDLKYHTRNKKDGHNDIQTWMKKIDNICLNCSGLFKHSLNEIRRDIPLSVLDKSKVERRNKSARKKGLKYRARECSSSDSKPFLSPEYEQFLITIWNIGRAFPFLSFNYSLHIYLISLLCSFLALKMKNPNNGYRLNHTIVNEFQIQIPKIHLECFILCQIIVFNNKFQKYKEILFLRRFMFDHITHWQLIRIKM